MIKVESPRQHGTPDMFKFWCKQKLRENPHWIFLQKKRILCYTNGAEYDHLSKRISEIDQQIMELEGKDTNKYTFTPESKEIFKLKDLMYKMIRERKELEGKVGTKAGRDQRTIVMTYAIFKDIIEDYNKEIVQMLLEGGTVYLGAGLGYSRIRGKKVDAKQVNNKRMINWPESNKLKQKLISQGRTPKDADHPDGENWLVYYDTSNMPYFRWAWIKNKGVSHVKNHKVYGFYPTAGDHSNKRKLAEFIRENPLAVNNFEMV